jgi:NADH-quinone oxidoreductase subunit F
MLAISRSLSEENYIPKKIVSLAGDIKNPGIYEIPFGISLRKIINEYGNGTKSEKAIKFVQVGGNTGTVFNEEELDTSFLYTNLMGNGTMLETAKIEIYNIDSCIVKWSFEKMFENSKETCGKCVYCREGIYQLYRIIKDATEGKGRDKDIDLVIELSKTMKAGSLCDFGKSASNPLYTAINKFRDEFEKHIDRKICDTLNCISYANYFIDPKVCNGCGECINCPQNAIKGGENLIHIIDQDSCDKCGKCEEVCVTKAVKRYGRIKPELPLEPVEVGSFKEGGLGEKKGLGLGRRKRK